MWICIAPCLDHTSKALRYGTHSQGLIHKAGHRQQRKRADKDMTSEHFSICIYNSSQ